MGFTAKKGSEKVLRRGSEKAVSRRCLERPLGEYAPLGVRPTNGFKCHFRSKKKGAFRMH